MPIPLIVAIYWGARHARCRPAGDGCAGLARTILGADARLLSSVAMNSETELPPSPRVVSNVRRLGPTHVPGLKRLVGLYSDIRQGEPLDDIRLDFDLSCGIAPLRIGNHDFQMGLRTCFVSLQLQNCDVHVGSRYEHWLDLGAIKASATQRTTTASSRNAGVSVEATADTVRGIAAIAAKLGLGASWKRDAKSEAVTKQSMRIELVVTSGQDRWRVGDLTRGDARRPDGILSGDYFLEERTKDGETLPLCRLRWINQSDPMQVTISVTAAFGSLLIFESDLAQNRGDVLTDDARAQMKRRSAKAESDHEELLRAHVAGLVAAKRLRNAQTQATHELVNNEFTIARLTVQCQPHGGPIPGPDTNA